MEINLTGESKGKSDSVMYSIPQDSYKAKIVAVGEPYMAKGYDTEEEQEKLTISFEIDLEGQKAKMMQEEENKEVEDKTIILKLWATTKITKGSANYSNSKLYDVIERMNLLPKFTEESGSIETAELLSSWLNDSLVGKYCKVMVKNSAKGVSRVNEVLRAIE